MIYMSTESTIDKYYVEVTSGVEYVKLVWGETPKEVIGKVRLALAERANPDVMEVRKKVQREKDKFGKLNLDYRQIIWPSKKNVIVNDPV